MRNPVDLKALNHEVLSPKIPEKAERAIFGIVIPHSTTLGRSQEHVKARDFDDRLPRRISGAMVDLVGKEEGKDRLTIAEPLERDESLKRLSCRAALSKLLTTIGSPAKIVRFVNCAEAP